MAWRTGKCPKCGTENPAIAKHCCKCGARIVWQNSLGQFWRPAPPKD